MKKLNELINNRMFACVTAFLLVFSVTLMFADEANAQTYNLTAKITSKKNKDTGKVPPKAIKGFKVTVSGGDLTTPLEKNSNKNGIAKFKGLAAGTYVVIPSKAGYKLNADSRTATLGSKTTTKVKFKSKKLPPTVGTASCSLCHGNSGIYSDWLQGPHGNFNNLSAEYSDFIASYTYPDHYNQFPGYPASSAVTSSCLKCHGPVKKANNAMAKSPLIEKTGSVDYQNRTQLARPVVSCESCHGGGKKHKESFGNKDIPKRAPPAEQCGQCHNGLTPDGHPGEADSIYNQYISSNHAESVNAHVVGVDGTTVTALCSKCHTDQGAKTHKNKDGDKTALAAAFVGVADQPEGKAVQCRTCHDPHDPEKLFEIATAATGTAAARSSQFNTCTNCHQLLDDSDGKIAGQHTGITANHFDDPEDKSAPSDEETIEGINVKQGADNSCTVCHNPHTTDNTINEQWAESGHGDFSGAGWRHYDWDCSQERKEADPNDPCGRASCQHCHTATGFANFVTDGDDYDGEKNDFSHLTGDQNEVLTCDACHKNDQFDMRTLSSVTFPSDITADLGDASNLCMVCHQGRSAGADVDDKITDDAPGPYSFTNIHYYPAAAIFMGNDTKGGYQYTGKTYVGKNTFSSHGANMKTCAGCHMRKDSTDSPDHEFEPKVADCSTCHSGIASFDDLRPSGVADYDGDGNTSEGTKAEISALGTALYAQMQTYATNLGSPIAIGDGYPYWFKDTNANGVADESEQERSNSYDFDEKLLKAAYNYQTYKKEPHAFIHNSAYMAQLLIDGIEDLGGSVAGYNRP